MCRVHSAKQLVFWAGKASLTKWMVNWQRVVLIYRGRRRCLLDENLSSATPPISTFLSSDSTVRSHRVETVFWEVASEGGGGAERRMVKRVWCRRLSRRMERARDWGSRTCSCGGEQINKGLWGRGMLSTMAQKTICKLCVCRTGNVSPRVMQVSTTCP